MEMLQRIMRCVNHPLCYDNNKQELLAHKNEQKIKRCFKKKHFFNISGFQPTRGAGKIRASTEAKRSLILMPNSLA